MSLIVRLAGSFTALVAVLALLLADSDAPTCEIVPFDRTYRLTSTCAEFGEETFRVRLASGDDGDQWPADLSHADGETTVVQASLEGRCSEDGDPVTYTELYVSLQPSGPGGSGTLGCFAPPEGGPLTCSSTVPAAGDCTFRIDPIEGD